MLAYGKIVINPELHEVSCQGKRVSLKPKEYELLTLFLQYPHHVLTHDVIISQIWGSDRLPSNSTVRSHIKMLRQSLKKCGESGDLIQTVHGLGYRLNPAEDENTQLFPSLSTLKKFLKAKAIEYLVFDQQYAIQFISCQVLNYCDYPEKLQIGNYLGDAFPELIGFEEDFEKVRNQEEGVFTLKGIGRSINPQRPEYLNFYVIGNNSKSPISSQEQMLFVFFEDDSENLILRQKLVQHMNQTFLTLELETTPQQLFSPSNGL